MLLGKIKLLIIRLNLFLERKFHKNNIYYINGSETLPPPLSAEEEEKNIREINREESRNLLIEHNLRLVAYIAKRFENTGASIEELISIGTVGLIKAISSFNLEKNIKLATYASRCIENEILMFLRKISKQKVEISLDEPLNIDGDGNELLLSDVIATPEAHALDEVLNNERERIMYQAVERLKPREKEIVVMRFGLYNSKNYTQKEVADILGISQSYISRLEKRIMNKLKIDMERKLTIASK